MVMTELDPGQAIKTAFDNATSSFKVKNNSGTLVTEQYNSIELTYVAIGNGAGEISTAVYKLDGTSVATLTLTYDSSNRLSTVVRS